MTNNKMIVFYMLATELVSTMTRIVIVVSPLSCPARSPFRFSPCRRLNKIYIISFLFFFFPSVIRSLRISSRTQNHLRGLRTHAYPPPVPPPPYTFCSVTRKRRKKKGPLFPRFPLLTPLSRLLHVSDLSLHRGRLGRRSDCHLSIHRIHVYVYLCIYARPHYCVSYKSPAHSSQTSSVV